MNEKFVLYSSLTAFIGQALGGILFNF